MSQVVSIRFTSAMQAEIAQDLLAQEGIESRLSGGSSYTFWDRDVWLYLSASDLQEAQELLEQYHDIIYGRPGKGNQAKLADSDSAKKLFCPYCHIGQLMYRSKTNWALILGLLLMGIGHLFVRYYFQCNNCDRKLSYGKLAKMSLEQI